jgi:DNA-binding MarR family transcriptional regulator
MSSKEQSAPSPDLAILLASSYRVLVDRLEQGLRADGLSEMRSTYGYVIRALARGELTATELAETLGVSKQAASIKVAEMEALDLIARRRDPTDGRRQLIGLAPKGRRVARRAMAASLELERELVEHFGREAVDTLREVLAGMVERHGDVANLMAGRSRAVW